MENLIADPSCDEMREFGIISIKLAGPHLGAFYLFNRAAAAYYGTAKPYDLLEPPICGESAYSQVGDKAYVSLRNAGGRVLAVYRIRTAGLLQRMRRWPAVLNKPVVEVRDR